ncbi:MAG: translocation/assembly module TamB domain-containing protein [Crocinitomicaceae bacterium]
MTSELGTDVHIDKVDIRFFDKVAIDGVYIADIKNDTFLYSQSINATIADWSISESFVNVSDVALDNGHLHMRKYEGDTTLNFQHIIDYFASDEVDTSSSNFKVDVAAFNLNDFHFVYDDENSEPIENGMDFAHLDINHLTGEFVDFKMDKGAIDVGLNALRFEDKSGLKLTHLTSQLHYDSTVVGLENLKLGLYNSYIHADYLKFKTKNGPSDWGDFLNKVRISSHLTKTKIFLSDLAYFVPDLWGLNGYLDINNVETKGAVYGMRLNDLDISLLDTTTIQGDFRIPRISDIESAIFIEDIALFRTSVSDVKKLRLERILNEEQTKTLNENLAQFASADVIRLENGSFKGGIESFVVDGDLYSGIGNVHSDYGLQFTFKDGLYHYKGALEESLGKHIIVENLNLGVITNNSLLGTVTGYLKIDGKGFDEKDLDIQFDGHLDEFGIYNYTYEDINIKKGSRFRRNVFDGEIDIEDDHLALTYDGMVDLNGEMHFDFEVKIDSAHIAELTPEVRDMYQNLASKVKVDIHGTGINSLYGEVKIENLNYSDTAINFGMDQMSLIICRSPEVDSFTLRSPYVDIDLHGKYNFEKVEHALTEQLAFVIDNVVKNEKIVEEENEFFSLYIKMKDVNSILQFYDPDIYVEAGTEIRSEFNHNEKSFAFNLNSAYVDYHGMEFEDVNLKNQFDSLKATVYYQVDYAKLTDSLEVRNVYLDSYIKDNKFLTNTGWDGVGKTMPALFAFESEITESFDVLTNFSPSFFYLKKHQYNVNPDSRFLWNPDQMVFENFKISNDDHFVKLDGYITKDPKRWLEIQINKFDLSDLNGLTGPDLELAGILNAQGKLSNLYDKVKFQAQSEISGFYLNKEMVGDVGLNARWNDQLASVVLNGNLSRDQKRTFTFSGSYFTQKEKDNIDIEAKFDHTDITFLNAFEDPELYTDIQGEIDGLLRVTGELENPKVTGQMDLVEARVKVPMMNVFFGANGRLDFTDGKIKSDGLRLKDQENNEAEVDMTIGHTNWQNWKYMVLLNMNDPSITKQFLAMDTQYKDGDYYYGKAYVTGFVGIFGDESNTDIDVDIKTKEGTDLTLPMFGTSDLEENSFVIFDEEFFLPDSLKSKGSGNNNQVNRLGMTLGMKFHVTPDAKVQIVFDPTTGDQIIAYGNADLEINMDDFGDLTMRGNYTVKKGTYEMRIKKLVEENFSLVQGGTVEWTGSPYDADINLKAQFTRNVAIGDIMPPEASTGNKKEDVYGILEMTNTLMKPELSFKVTSDTKNDLEKKALAELAANEDELNKQFFALLVLKRFIPTYGGGAGGENVVLGLAETQINAILGGLSESYDVKAGLSDGKTTVGIEKQLNERTTISTSFGVLNPEDGQSVSGGNIVGDVDIEYRLNDDGTFTMNFFNETNEASITAQGHFTQGVSLHYQETFTTTKEFKLLQKFLNIFRKKENRVKFESEDRRSDKWVPLPEEE